MTDSDRLKQIKARLAVVTKRIYHSPKVGEPMTLPVLNPLDVDELWANKECMINAPADMNWLIAENERLQAELEAAQKGRLRAIEYAHREGSNALAQREKIKALIDSMGQSELGHISPERGFFND